MNCDSWRSRAMEFARGRLSDTERNGIAAHLRVCPDCSVFLEQQMVLTTALTQLAAYTAIAPPADLEPMLLARFDSTRSWRRRYFKPAAAIGAMAAALAAFAVLRAPPRSAPLQPVVPRKTTVASPPAIIMPALKPVLKSVRRKPAPEPMEDAEPFVAIPFTVPLDPREPMTVMRVEMPVSALVAVGLSVAPPDPGASAQADVVVGEDGRIRAIRLVSLRSSAFDSDRRVN